MSAYEPGCDVVVVNRQTPEDLARFLTALDANPPERPIRLVVAGVEPGVEDLRVGTMEWASFDRTFIGFADNVGYNRACNLAGAVGRREVVVLCNADVVLTGAVIDECAQAVLDHPEYGLLGPRQVDSQGRFTAAGIFGAPRKPQHRGWRERDRGQYSDVRTDAVTVAGSVMFLRREVWDEIHSCPLRQRFDPGAAGPLLQADHYYGETGLAREIAAHGYQLVYWGPTVCIHEWHRASRHGGWGEQRLSADRELFRRFCAAHQMEAH